MAADREVDRSGAGRTKGMAWADQIRVFERTYGRDRLLAAVRAMPPQWRQGLDERHPVLGVLDASWYLEEQRNAFFDAVLAGLSLIQQQSLARVMAKQVMDRSLRGLHKMIFAVMATPERFVKHAQSLWNMHHDTGRLALRMPTKSSMEATVLEWPTHHPFACMLNHYACLVTLEEMGLRDITEHRVCAFRDRAACTGTYIWRSR